VQFSWDSRKASANLSKHRVAFAEAVTVFVDPLALIVEDPVHAERAWIVGESVKQRVLLVVFVEIVDRRVRIISARRATAHERRRYEEGE
jgi:uncharacterized DUF497 family protein